jgi:hypothetical protein
LGETFIWKIEEENIQDKEIPEWKGRKVAEQEEMSLCLDVTGEFKKSEQFL